MYDKKTGLKDYNKKIQLPPYCYPWGDEESAAIEKAIGGPGGYKKMTHKELRQLSRIRMDGRNASDVLREMRDEGW